MLAHMMLDDKTYIGALFATLYTAWSYSGFSHLTKAASSHVHTALQTFHYAVMTIIVLGSYLAIEMWASGAKELRLSTYDGGQKGMIFAAGLLNSLAQ